MPASDHVELIAVAPIGTIVAARQVPGPLILLCRPPLRADHITLVLLLRQPLPERCEVAIVAAWPQTCLVQSLPGAPRTLDRALVQGHKALCGPLGFDVISATFSVICVGSLCGCDG